MTRLSIVDTDEMSVPWEVDGLVISFNGEIYNWRELRDELISLGYQFRTETDTEVVLAAYREWGTTCLDRFNGMFSIAIWDGEGFFLCRDRFGKKPLFLRLAEGTIAFASEVKSFNNLTYEPVAQADALEFYFDEHTPFRTVTSVRPAEWLYWNAADGSVTREQWWSFPDYAGDLTDMREALDIFLPLFTDACQLRAQAGVPVTMFLSGGIDSSLIQAIMRFDTTFTVQFEEFEDFLNEQELTAELAAYLGFDNHVIRPDRDDFADCLPLLARHIEFPVGSFSIFPLYCLSRAARAQGFEVALSGEGADELFNGYYRNEILLGENQWIEEHVSEQYSALGNRYFGTQLDRYVRMASRHGDEDTEILKGLLTPLWNESAPLHHNIAAVESQLFMQPLLTMADRMSMANSFEVRNPFLDHRIVEFSTRLASNLRFHEGRGKALLRAALREVLGNDDLGVVRRQVKHGLPAPVNQWVFNTKDLDRKAWNDLLIGECLRQLTLPASRAH